MRRAASFFFSRLPRRRRRDGVERLPRAGEQCARWQLRRVRLATEVATGFPFLLHGVPAPLESAIPFDAVSFDLRPRIDGVEA